MLTLGIVMAVTGRFGNGNAAAWKRGLILGVVAMALPMTFTTLALEELPISLSGVLIALIPLSTIGAAHFIVAGERFAPRSLSGLFIALAGSAVLVGVGGNSVDGVGNLSRGVALMVIGVLLAGLGGALSRRFALETPSDDLVLPQFTVNTVVLFVFTPLLSDLDVGSVDGASWLLIAGVDTIGTTLPFASFLIAAGMNPASRLGLTGYTVPIVAVTLAVVFLGESVTPAILGGATLILTGVVLADRATDSHIPAPGVTTSR